MELLIAILFLVIVILIVQQKKAYAKHMQEIKDEIGLLHRQIKKLEGIAPKKVTPVPEQESTSAKTIPEPEIFLKTEQKPLPEAVPVLPTKDKQPPVIQEIKQVITTPPITPPAKEPASRIPAKPGFFERNPDLEKFIGENLVSKIGIAILVLAIGFFVKYAIDNDWIGHAGRVAIGVACGSILVWLAHRLQKNYQAFSSVLVGGGLAIFYFTIALAYHEYQLFPQLVTFIIMLVITAFAVTLSFLYNRQELAIIALVGGFATPFMASNGSGSYVTLFIYLIILNVGLLVIAYRKTWRLLNLLAFLFTIVLFASWTALLFDKEPVETYYNGFIFASIFYLLFLAINIAHNIRENKKFIASDFGILLANTCVYFSAGLYFITKMGAGEYKGLFTAIMGFFNMGLSYLLFRNRKVDANILYLLIGITLTFVSLTAPIQLSGNHITLFWACEMVLLFWLYQKSGIRLMRYGAAALTVAMLVSLFMDWVIIYGNNKVIPVVANKAFITTMFAALACLLLAKLQTNFPHKNDQPGLPQYRVYLIAGSALLYAAGALETVFQFSTRYGNQVGIVYFILYTMAFVALLGIIAGRWRLFNSPPVITVLYVLVLLLFLLQLPVTYAIQRNIQQGALNVVHFAAHWISAAFFIWIFFCLVKSLGNAVKAFPIVPWLLCLMAVTFLSVEGSLLCNTLFYKAGQATNVQRVYAKTGLPILWGLSSFALMWMGMKRKNRTLRIISLVVFGITLLKLFIFDIRNIPVAGKIAAFFSLGVLLLIISFMYQRLKKIIIEDEKTGIPN